MEHRIVYPRSSQPMLDMGRRGDEDGHRDYDMH